MLLLNILVNNSHLKDCTSTFSEDATTLNVKCYLTKDRKIFVKIITNVYAFMFRCY